MRPNLTLQVAHQGFTSYEYKPSSLKNILCDSFGSWITIKYNLFLIFCGLHLVPSNNKYTFKTKRRKGYPYPEMVSAVSDYLIFLGC